MYTTDPGPAVEETTDAPAEQPAEETAETNTDENGSDGALAD